MDRMFRSALDALKTLRKLQKRGISLHMLDLGGDVTGNGISKMMFTILAAVAEGEHARIVERITEVKADQRQRGRFLGGHRPFGWEKVAVKDEKGFRLEEVLAEQEAIKRMVAMKADGKSLRAIRDVMRAEGHKISHETVARVLGA